MSKNIIDIETSVNWEAVESFHKPFDPDSVSIPKTYKKPEAIEAYVEKARATHEASKGVKAALTPHLAKIVALGIHEEDSGEVILEGFEDGDGEEFLLGYFWSKYTDSITDANLKWCYYGGAERGNPFDPWMILNRTRIVCPELVPAGFLNKWGFPECFVDLAPLYLYGDFGAYCSVNDCIERLGLVGKDVGFAHVRSKEEIENESGITGATFHESMEDDPVGCMNYLINDLACERAIQQTIYP